MLRVAVVGSGPAGIYAAAALTDAGETARGPVSVDVLDRLPCPFGLVRYGVAPDHERIKSISDALARLLEHPSVRFLGNVEVGVDLTLADLHDHYDAVVLAYGAALGRRLDIPGEDLPGSFSATDFVAWYSGHPDAVVDRFTLDATDVVVLGVGNVALDVARVLAKSADELRATDLPEAVLSVLERSRVRAVSVVGRRGPAQAKFTTKELREFGDLANADVVVEPSELALDEASVAALASDASLRRNVDVLRGWAQRPQSRRPRRIFMRFLLRPVEILGTHRVTGVRFERVRLDGSGGVVGTGDFVEIPAQMVLRSVGYHGRPLDGLPFDASAGTIPHMAGRVLRGGGQAPGEYVAGWIKRGPTGVIGTNKHDARETVTSLLADVAALPPAANPDPDAILALLARRGVNVVTWDGWRAIELAEAERGRAHGRQREKIVDRSELLRLAGSGSPGLPAAERAGADSARNR